MKPFRVALSLFEWIAGGVALYAAAQPALYQLRVSYRQTDRLFEFWIATLLLVLTVRAVRHFRDGRIGMSTATPPLRSHHVLQLATLTASASQAIALLAPINTIETAAVSPSFAGFYLAAQVAIAIFIAWRADPDTLRGSAILLVVLSGLNGRLFNADFAILLPLALATIARWIDAADSGTRRFTLFEGGLFALIGCAILGTIVAPEPGASYAVLVRFAFFALLAVIVRAAVRSERDARQQLALQVVVGLAICGLTILAAALALEHATPRAIFNTRFQIFNAHPNLVGPFHAVNALLALGFLLYLGRSRPQRVLATIGLLVMVGVLVQAGSKAALGAFVFGAMLLGLLGRPGVERGVRSVLDRAFSNPKMILAAVLVPVGLVALFLIAPRGMRDRMTPSGIRQTLEYRLDIWGATLHVIKDHPWFGVGIENYSLAASHLETTTAQDQTSDPHPHNLYLAVAQAAGLPGLLCLLVAIVGLMLRMLRAHRVANDVTRRHLLVTCGAGFVLILAASMLDVGLGLGTFLPPSLLVLGGIASGVAQIADPDHEPWDAGSRGSGSLGRNAALVLTLVLFSAVTLRSAAVSREIYSARLAHRSGEIARAREHYERAAALDPINTQISLALIDVYKDSSTGNANREASLQAALERLQAMVRRTPDDASLYARISRLYREMNQLEEAVAAARQAIQHAPETVTAAPYYSELGLLLWVGVKDLDGAFEAYKRALILDIGIVNRIVWTYKVRREGTAFDDQYIDVDGKDPKDAQSHRRFRLEDLIASIVADYEAKIAAGERPDILEWLKVYHMYLNAGDYEEAERIAERIGKFPNYNLVTIDREIADVELRRGDYDKAIEYYRRGLAARPNFTMYIGAAEAYRRKGDLDLARANLEASLSLKEDLIASDSFYRTVYSSLAEISEQQGKVSDARRFLRDLLYFSQSTSERFALLLRLAKLARSAGAIDDATLAIREAIDVLILNGVDLVKQGIDNPVRELARETVLAFSAKYGDPGQSRQALLDLSDPETQQSTSPAFSAFAAWVRLALDDLDGAHELLARSREENRMNRLADLAAIDLLIASGRRENADKLFTQLIELDSRTGYRAERERGLKQRLDATQKSPSFDLRLEIADHYFLVGAIAEAAGHYKQLVTGKNGDARVDARLGRALFFQGDPGAANLLFRRAAEKAPEDPFYPRLARGASL